MQDADTLGGVLRKIIIGAVATAAFAGPGVSAAALPRVPLYYQYGTGARVAAVEPANTTLTGDGASFFGGRTGRVVMNESQLPLGTLEWPVYTNSKAVATGVWWCKFTRGYHSYRIFATVKLIWSRPVRGVFSRLHVAQTYTHAEKKKSAVGKTETYNYDYLTEKYSGWRGPLR